jgi:hypothetical protein
MPKNIILLDVDDTLIIDNNHRGIMKGGFYWNDALIDALLSLNLKQVYLFTAYDLGGVPKTYEDQSTWRPSRLRLIEYLQEKGLEVLGVITTLDPAYGQGVGRYYKDRILPFEQSVHREESGLNLEVYRQKHEEEMQLKEIAFKAGKLATIKAEMYEYFVDQLPTEETIKIAFIDDKKAYLEQVATRNSQLANPRKLISIEAGEAVQGRIRFKTSREYRSELARLFPKRFLGLFGRKTRRRGDPSLTDRTETTFKY